MFNTGVKPHYMFVLACGSFGLISRETPDPQQAKAVARILFESGSLRPYLHGSVIEFVSIDVYRSQFTQLWETLDAERISSVTAKLDAIDQYLVNLSDQLKKVKQLRHHLAIAALMP